MPEQNGAGYHSVRVLDCDTIGQVKDKILDSIYRHTPHSSRPSSNDLDLGMHHFYVIVAIVSIFIMLGSHLGRLILHYIGFCKLGYNR